MLMTGLSSLLGGLSNTKAARTGTNAATFGGTQSGSSTPTYNPLQSGMQGTVAGTLQKQLSQGIDTTPMATAGTNNINATYKSIGDRLNESLASRGFGNSGASGTAALQTELGRAGAVGDLQSQLQGYALQQQQDTLGKALGFGFANPGSTSTSTNTGSSYGTSVLPGSAAAGALSGGMTSLMQMLNAAAAAGGM